MDELVTKSDQLKMKSADGKYYLTDVGDIETIFRLIQSIPSPKAEPIKLWLAKNARVELENRTGRKVVNRGNFLESKIKKEIR